MRLSTFCGLHRDSEQTLSRDFFFNKQPLVPMHKSRNYYILHIYFWSYEVFIYGVFTIEHHRSTVFTSVFITGESFGQRGDVLQFFMWLRLLSLPVSNDLRRLILTKFPNVSPGGEYFGSRLLVQIIPRIFF
jgi:hypothetical protein